MAAAFFTVFFVVGAGAVVTGSPSGFESGDGNMVLNATGGTNTDWNCFVGTDNFQSGSPDSNCKVKTGATQTWADGGTTSVGTNEYEFKGGTKFDTECPVIQTGHNPSKDEWSNIAEYTEVGPTPNFDLWFYGASIRPTVNGNSSGNVYFNQGANPKGPGCHTVGDILLAFNFLNGGGNPHMFSLTWIDSGTCYQSQDAPPCWGNEQGISATYFEGNVNSDTIALAENGISGTLLQPNAFAEFGINLTEAIQQGNNNQPLPCFASQTWVSRSSGSSFTSQPEDVETVSRPTCGSLTIIKHSDPRGINQAFTYTPSSNLNSGSTFKLNDGGNTAGSPPPDVNCTSSTGSPNTDGSPCNKITFSNLSPGSYTVTEASQGGYALESLICKNHGTTDTSVADKSTGTVTITMEPQDSWVCTYQNQALGEIRIIKETSPRGIDQVFGYSSNFGTPSASNVSGTVACTPSGTAGISSGAFCLNDAAGTTPSSGGSDNTLDYTNVPIGDYNVTESLPTSSGWTLGSLTCTATGTGSSGQQDTGASADPLKADITLAAGGLVKCTYVNNQPTGAIVITKTGKYVGCTDKAEGTHVTDASGTQVGVCTGNGDQAALGNAVFTVQGTDLLGNAIGPTDVTTSTTTGKVCIDGLPWNGSSGNNSFSVTEKTPPPGYAKDSLNTDPQNNVTVTQNATCTSDNSDVSTGTATLVTFNDVPLTNLTTTASAVLKGATSSTITCTTSDSSGNYDSSGAAIGNSPQTGDPVTVTADKTHNGALQPGIYYCKVVIDP